MKKIIIIVVIAAAILLVGIGVLIYMDIQENKRIDAEAVTLKENLTVEFGTKSKVSDFIEMLKRKPNRRCRSRYRKIRRS